MRNLMAIAYRFLFVFAWCGSAESAPESVAPHEPVSGVAFGSNLYVVVGGQGGIYRSSDLQHWEYNRLDTPVFWTGCAYGNGTFVATSIVPGLGGRAGLIATSVDGSKWIERERIEEDLFRIIFANDRFVAVGDKGSLLSSSDGLVWKRSSTGTDSPLRSVAFGNGLFVVGGGSSLEEVLITSPDLTNWRRQQADMTQATWGLAYGNGVFVAASGYDSVGLESTLFTSQDGFRWERRSLNVGVGIIDVAFGDGRFVAVGDQGTILSSTDGIRWDQVDSGVSEHFVRATYTGRRFLAIWDQGTHGIAQSGDGSAWDKVVFEDVGRPRFRVSATSHRPPNFVMMVEPRGARRVLLESSSNLRDWTIRHDIRIEDDRPFPISDSLSDSPQLFYRLYVVSP